MTENESLWKVADLFSGAGGMSCGFAAFREHFRIVAAVDLEMGKPGIASGQPKRIHCNDTYERNIGVRPLNRDLNELEPEEFMALADIAPTELTVLIACPPCTGFSQKNAMNHLKDDPRNRLVQRTALFVEKLRPEFLVMENVKELMNGKMSHHYLFLRNTLKELGYSMRAEIHDLSEWGLPQKRTRALIVARRDGGPLPSFPSPVSEAVTVRDAIGHLPPLKAGETDPNDPMHCCPSHNAVSMERIRATPHDGGSWCDLRKENEHLLIPSMKNARPGSFPDIYGRLWWDRPAITVTRECGHPGNGRYLHPEQDRMLSVREMALLQGFPSDYCFEGPLSSKYNQIGDAVPPSVSARIARYIIDIKTGGETIDTFEERNDRRRREYIQVSLNHVLV